MSDFVNELNQTSTKGTMNEKATSEKEERLIGAYKNAAKIKSPTAQRVFLEKFLPQMESQLGLVNFVADDVREIIRENPLQATNIVELMKNAQRKMKAESSDKKAFNPSDEPLHVGRVFSPEDLEVPERKNSRAISHSNYRVQAAIKVIKNRVKDLSKLKSGPALDVLRAVLSDSFSDEEIEEVFYLLGVR